MIISVPHLWNCFQRPIASKWTFGSFSMSSSVSNNFWRLHLTYCAAVCCDWEDMRMLVSALSKEEFPTGNDRDVWEVNERFCKKGCCGTRIAPRPMSRFGNNGGKVTSPPGPMSKRFIRIISCEIRRVHFYARIWFRFFTQCFPRSNWRWTTQTYRKIVVTIFYKSNI